MSIFQRSNSEGSLSQWVREQDTSTKAALLIAGLGFSALVAGGATAIAHDIEADNFSAAAPAESIALIGIGSAAFLGAVYSQGVRTPYSQPVAAEAADQPDGL